MGKRTDFYIDIKGHLKIVMAMAGHVGTGPGKRETVQTTLFSCGSFSASRD